jgi:predicted amidohydrolase YtcJ
MKFSRLIFSFFLLCLPVFAQQKTAELAIINANVRTMDAARPRAEAVAIAGNKIIAVGTNKEIRALIGKQTKTIDAQSRLVLPGFNDSHVHFAGIGNQFFATFLQNAKSADEVLETIEFYVRFLPKGNWILGGAWNHQNWNPAHLPNKNLIDAATPDHPVFLYNRDATIALVNSLTLKMAGINRNTKDFPNGEIERDAQGEPTGILKGRAIDLVRNLPPRLPTRNLRAVAETASNYAASLGVTSVQDVHSDDNSEIYRELARQGKLKTRIYDCAWLSDWQKLTQAGIRRASGDAFVRGGCLKYFSEGDPEDFAELYEKILPADRAGLQVMVHAIGNAPNNLVLTVFERVIEINGARDRRFRIEHAHRVRPIDVTRFGTSKIIASVQPHLFFGGFGNDSGQYRAFLDTGATLAFGSDASITDFNPLYGIAAAVAGNSKQALTVEEAVRAYTVGSAYAEFQEDFKGSITPGKLADLVILSNDIFSINPNHIRKASVLTTVVDGKVVFESK